MQTSLKYDSLVSMNAIAGSIKILAAKVDLYLFIYDTWISGMANFSYLHFTSTYLHEQLFTSRCLFACVWVCVRSIYYLLCLAHVHTRRHRYTLTHSFFLLPPLCFTFALRSHVTHTYVFLEKRSTKYEASRREILSKCFLLHSSTREILCLY